MLIHASYLTLLLIQREIAADNHLIANNLNNDGKPLTQIVMLSLFSANEFTSFLDMYETINI